MRERLLWLVPIMESLIVAVLGARYQATKREQQVDLEEAYEHMMRARSSISRCLRSDRESHRPKTN